MPGEAADGPGLCWRPWPCAACSGGLSALGFLIRCAEADGAFPKVLRTPEQIAEFQIRQLHDWVSSCPHTVWNELGFPKVAEGSEHLVYLDHTVATVWKATRPHVFGDSYYLVEGRIHQKNDSPLEYLMRLRLWERLFLSAPIPVGLSRLGQIVSTHEFITGVIPSQEAVDAFLSDAGLVPVKQRFWLWKKVESDAEIWVGDARDENFVQSPAGIVPIDLRIWSIPSGDV